MFSVLVLTKNEEQDLPGCLASVSWCDDIHVFDSFSNDRTADIALAVGAKVSQRKFDNWATHQNWGLANIPFKYEWVLYLDADERVSDSLRRALLDFQPTDQPKVVAYAIQRRDYAWDGTWLKHAQISPYYMRFFRYEKMRYERLVNPISVPDGMVSKLPGYLDHYPFSKGIHYWLQRHIGYASLEADTQLQNNNSNSKKFSVWKAIFDENFSIRRYHQKGLFNKVPVRPIFKFFYMIIIRRSFLDGKAGIVYSILQSIYE